MPRSKLAETLAAISAGMREVGVRWYVFGAQAAILHGIARATVDVDVTADLGRRRAKTLVAALRKQGLRLHVPNDAFVETTRVLPLVHDSGMPVDVVLAGPGLEALFFERVVHRTVGGVRVPVASPEDIVVMKVLAGRPKDLEDVRGILAANPKLDLEQARATLRDLEEALGQSDLLPVFEAIARRHRGGSRRAAPRRKRRARG